MLGFLDFEKDGGIPNEFPPGNQCYRKTVRCLTNFDWWGGSCDILYSSLFEKRSLNRGSIIPYDHSDLQAFTTHSWVYVELMVFVGVERDLWSINTQFLYNYILGTPFTVELDVMDFLVHLKLKYLNLHGKSNVLCADLEADKKYIMRSREIKYKTLMLKSKWPLSSVSSGAWTSARLDLAKERRGQEKK